MPDKVIPVIGGGVSGITTALLLQLLGNETRIVTEYLIDLKQEKDRPLIASLYPSASVIPHSVYSGQLKKLFINSQELFKVLNNVKNTGVTVHKHFEVFEYEVDPPGYTEWMIDTKLINEINSDDIPRRVREDNLFGWVFESFFADWPVYFPQLLKWYHKAGGKIEMGKVTASDIRSTNHELIINCSGYGSKNLFNDPAPHMLVRGHLLHVKNAPFLFGTEGKPISYNYTPGSTVYADGSGNPCDLYFYPRKDGWIIGGSRQKGVITDNGEWLGDKTEDPCREIDGIRIPEQIFIVNKKILQNYGFSIESYDKSVFEAYRYIRSEEEGLRLELTEESGTKVLHNYGHGGAGVTLSWGCAVEAARILIDNEFARFNPDHHSNPVFSGVIDALESFVS